MNITIQKADISHLPQVVNILDAASLKLLAKGVHQWEYPWDMGVVKGYIENKGFYIVICDGETAGCFGLKKFDSNPFNGDNSGRYFYHLAIHPVYSGKGIGSAVCHWIQQFAKDNGITIYFDCWAGNDRLRKFYIGNGFDYIGDFPEEDYFVSAFKTKNNG